MTGIVTAIGATEIQVDLGCKQAGYIPVSELSSDPDAKVEDIVHVGDEIETYIVRVNDGRAMPPFPRSASTRSRSGRTSRMPLRIRLFSRASSPKKTRAASSFPSRACVCSFPLPRAVCPRTAT